MRPQPLPSQEQSTAWTKTRKFMNPLQTGITAYLAGKAFPVPLELKDIPKRYTRYGSLLLLGPAFPTQSPVWTELFASLSRTDKAELFGAIVSAFRDGTLTHVAINAPITAMKLDTPSEQNIVRSPTNLQPAYGDFGPGIEECDEQNPTTADVEAAYWTGTVQLNNIVQTWAPRWTMFSRGNISEKARILQGDLVKAPFPGLEETELGQRLGEVDVVDLYVGIGYFAFCYLSRGVARVWGFEINGWSVEGLRRGCVENGWGVRVIKIDEDGNVFAGQTVPDLVTEILDLDGTASPIRCVVFKGNNKWASKILDEVKTHMSNESSSVSLNVRHCNLGLLPSSENSWDVAVQLINSQRGGWLHVHENVEISTIGTKKVEILDKLIRAVSDHHKTSWSAACCHVEQVKTYAPGVVHCVYDIQLLPPG